MGKKHASQYANFGSLHNDGIRKKIHAKLTSKKVTIILQNLNNVR